MSKPRVWHLLMLLLLLLLWAEVNVPTLVGSGGWTRTWGGIGDDVANGVAIDSGGNVYVSGYTDSFGAPSTRVLLLKYNSSGSLTLQETWGGNSTDYGRAIALDSAGNIYVTGETRSFGGGDANILLIKFNARGDTIWQRIWGGQLAI